VSAHPPGSHAAPGTFRCRGLCRRDVPIQEWGPTGHVAKTKRGWSVELAHWCDSNVISYKAISRKKAEKLGFIDEDSVLVEAVKWRNLSPLGIERPSR